MFEELSTLSEALRTTLVYTTAWFAIFLYAWTVVRLGLERRATPRPRFLWSAGCLIFLVHVAGAFDVFYQWDHVRAYRQTMQDTMNLTGIRSGFGLYLNYLFTAVWLVDMIWWWVVGDERYRRRSRFVFGLMHVFFLFMIFNGGFYFVDGWVRWIGLGLSVIGVTALVRNLSRAPATSPSSTLAAA